MSDNLPVIDSAETLRQARGLATRAESRTTAIGLAIGYIVLSGSWLLLAGWMRGSQWAARSIAPSPPASP